MGVARHVGWEGGVHFAGCPTIGSSSDRRAIGIDDVGLISVLTPESDEIGFDGRRKPKVNSVDLTLFRRGFPDDSGLDYSDGSKECI